MAAHRHKSIKSSTIDPMVDWKWTWHWHKQGRGNIVASRPNNKQPRSCSVQVNMASKPLKRVELIKIKITQNWLNCGFRNQLGLWFLQRVSIACYAERCISHSKSVRLSVCPSDRPSVTRWHWVKTTQATIMGPSLEDSPMTLVSSTLNFTPKFQREHGERGRRMREG